MTCCGSNRPPKRASAARAVLCATCRHAERAPWWAARLCLGWLWPAYGIPTLARDTKNCRLSGWPTTVHVKGKAPCPRRRHRQMGRTRWWCGTPAYLRLAAWAIGHRWERISLAPGCGCWRPLKDLWEAAWAWVLGIPQTNRSKA